MVLHDGNGRMSRLLTTLLLYRSGFYVGKYISLEAKIAENKDLYYDALGRAQEGWHEGTEDVVPFIKYLLGTILAAYKDFEDRFSIVEEKIPAIDMVRKATLNKIGKFTKQDIRELCPALSISSIEGALRNLVKAGELKREGSGKGTAEASNSAAGYTTSATESAVKQDWKSQKEAQSAQRKRENALKRCEERIAVLEARSAQIDEEMSLPEVCTDVARLQALSEEKAAVEEELLMKMEEWEALSE